MMSQKNKIEPEGTPLAVCVNDCQLDYGQPGLQLAPVCFRVRCAFAEMRWGKSGETYDEIMHLAPQQVFQIVSGKY